MQYLEHFHDADRFCRNVLLLLLLLGTVRLSAQTVDISIGGSSNVDFTFNTIKTDHRHRHSECLYGECGSIGTNWDLYMGAVAAVAGTWDNAQCYATKR